jgi:hypothetical protein
MLHHMAGARIMRNAVDPSPQAGAAIKNSKTLPEFKVNILHQIFALCRVPLIGIGQPSYRRPILLRGKAVMGVL